MVEFFSKKKQEILDLELRRKIYELVQKFSGSNFRELLRKIKIPHSTLQYHLHYLVKHQLLIVETDGNKVRYFVPKKTQENKQLLACLRQKNIRKILLLLLNKRECKQREIIAFLELSPSTVSWYVTKLVKNGVLEVKKSEKESVYKLAIRQEEVLSLLITYRESFFDTLVDQTIEMWS